MNTGDTMFAPAEKASIESILHDVETLNKTRITEHFIHQFPSIVMILNKQRQVVYKNQQLMDLLDAKTDDEILGKRPGDL
ncbi:MAG TPA: sensor histidine kinase, partial [Candidatus Kapabacteria bacterium]|nr:sensor histidine kinase [Candidatus Kapabacteria bacterium]